jgi:hypothetical protein
MHDIIIVGGGVSGLYAALQIKKKRPTWSIVVLEKAPELGGRAGVVPFHGVPVLPGAGIGRYPYDKKLLALCHSLGIATHKFGKETAYSSDIPFPEDLKKALQEVRQGYRPEGRHRGQTFRQVALSILGPERYANFQRTAGYTDWEQEDPEEAIRTIPVDDDGWEWSHVVGIPWDQVLDAMASKIGRRSIFVGQEVVSLEPITSAAGNIHPPVRHTRKRSTNAAGYRLQTQQGRVWTTRRLILSTDIAGIKRLLPEASRVDSPFKDIVGQPFLRVYAHFPKESAEVMARLLPKTTVVGTQLFKLIPMDAAKGVHMIAYTDNAGAKHYTRNPEHLRNTPVAHRYWAREVERAFHLPAKTLEIDDLSIHDWPIGTHYFRPLDRSRYASRGQLLRKVQNPRPGLFVVGEGISQNQGWTEGALESVDKVLPDILRAVHR